VTEPVRRPLSRMRRAIVKSMTASALVPQFTIESEPSVAALAEQRTQLQRADPAISYSDLVVAASARSLVQFPALNSSLVEDAIVEHGEVNIGLAVALSEGLIAPAICHANRLTLSQIAAERQRLAEAARQDALSAQDIFSTTFTISNLGPFGVRRFRALVVPPQAAILALGAITPEQTLSLALSCDHRVLDGAVAAEFLSHLVGLIERPAWFEQLLDPADASEAGPG
jgi:pyruvate dehydrogenase E2 component (dihydrolipoamide acetyltransferase)